MYVYSSTELHDYVKNTIQGMTLLLDVMLGITNSLWFATPVDNGNAKKSIENHSGTAPKHKSFLLNLSHVYVVVAHNV